MYTTHPRVEWILTWLEANSWFYLGQKEIEMEAAEPDTLFVQPGQWVPSVEPCYSLVLSKVKLPISVFAASLHSPALSCILRSPGLKFYCSFSPESFVASELHTQQEVSAILRGETKTRLLHFSGSVEEALHHTGSTYMGRNPNSTGGFAVRASGWVPGAKAPGVRMAHKKGVLIG